MKSVLKDAFFQGLHHIGGRLAIFALLIIVAREVSVEEFGLLQLLLVIQSVLLIFFDGGINQIVVREVAGRGALEEGLWRRKRRWWIFSSLFVGVSVIALPLPLEKGWIALVAVAALASSKVNFCQFLFRGFGAAHLESGISLFHKLLGAAVAVWLIYVLGAGIGSVFVANVIAAVLAVAIAYRAFGRYRDRIIPGDGKVEWTALGSLVVVEMGTWLYFRVDVLILEQIKDRLELGLYAAAYTLFTGVAMVSVVIMAALFPRLAKAKSSSERRPITYGGLVLLTVIAAGLYVFLSLTGAQLLTALFGEKYSPAQGMLIALLPAFFFMFPNGLLTHLLILQKREHVFAAVVLMGAALNIALNLLWIPADGGIGAARATVWTEVFLLAGTTVALGMGRRSRGVAAGTAQAR